MVNNLVYFRLSYQAVTFSQLLNMINIDLTDQTDYSHTAIELHSCYKYTFLKADWGQTVSIYKFLKIFIILKVFIFYIFQLRKLQVFKEINNCWSKVFCSTILKFSLIFIGVWILYITLKLMDMKVRLITLIQASDFYSISENIVIRVLNVRFSCSKVNKDIKKKIALILKLR